VKPNELLQLLLYFGLLIGLTPFLGGWMARVFERETTGRFEKLIYRLGRVDAREEMSWKRYLWAGLAFNAVGFGSLFAILITQTSWHLAVNTAMSFVTNTNWQAYSGENTLNYFSQMAGLAVHNFLSAATGIAVMLAIARGLKRASTKTIGNFWVDLTRATLYVLLPLSVVFALVLVWQGVPQTLAPYRTVKTLEGADQVVPVGPAASQVAIKQLGTNGGGFYGQNSAHPFENPTPLSNFLEMLAILLLPAALVYTFGVMVGDRRHAWCLFGVMLVLLLAGFSVGWWAEAQHGTMEGKEVRFGMMNSVLWGTATTATSNGSVNSMHDSFTPLAGLVTLWNIMLGEIVFGGIGSGMYGILLHVLLAVFIAGLMVGRTPEYLGKKIQAWEASWAVVGVLVPSALILIGSGIACAIPAGLSSLNNAGPHGLSEIFYAFSSAANNNGSAFAGLNANTPFYNLSLAACMLIGRFIVIVAALAIAGSLAGKKTVPASPGTFPTNGLTFAVVLLGIIVIVGALTFFPALCLGPIVEHGLMTAGRVF
jgi:potassium-transporting ATPase potassium-binding subunit